MKLIISFALPIFFFLSTPSVSATVLHQKTNSRYILSISKEEKSQYPIIQQFKTALKIAKEELNSKKNHKKTSRILLVLGLILLVIGLIGSLPYLNLAGNTITSAQEKRTSRIFGFMVYLGVLISILGLIFLIVDATIKKQSIKTSFNELRDLIKFNESKPA